ncbi:MAG: hypothetical protein QME45_14480 [Clostridiales bacterium]|nr:hypothetical protein [Clostridiales bacterium]HBM80279.1 hypothetical protein [Clostridiaceae bacterium]
MALTGEGTNVPAIVGQEIVQALQAPQAAGGAPPTIPPTTPIDIQGELNRILSIITSINDIRAQIIRLGLNPSLRFAIETEVVPVLNILTALATSADFFSVAAYNMSNINFAKSHEIRKMLELIYNIADLSEDVFEVLEKLVIATLPKSP